MLPWGKYHAGQRLVTAELRTVAATATIASPLDLSLVDPKPVQDLALPVFLPTFAPALWCGLCRYANPHGGLPAVAERTAQFRASASAA